MTFQTFLVQRVQALVSEVATKRDIYFDSLLELGCGRRPQQSWFGNFSRSEEPRRYIAIETDVAAAEALQEQGILTFKGFNAPIQLKSDLVLALDMLQDIRADRLESFLADCERQTGKVFALTVPNVGPWLAGATADLQGLRWKPDFIGKSLSETRARASCEINALQQHLVTAFPEKDWDLTVGYAWPWRIEDMTTSQIFEVHLKILALAVRKPS